MRQLSREVDMTIIQVSENSEKEYMSAEGYFVIPINADTYQKKMHNIEI